MPQKTFTQLVRLGTGPSDSATPVSEASPFPVKVTGIGLVSDTLATWFDQAASLVGLMKLAVAVYAKAGSWAYTYWPDGTRKEEIWTLLGVVRKRSYSYDQGRLAGISDWVVVP